jgi:cellulose binding protein with CBM2 domain/fibronectin type III domain protein
MKRILYRMLLLATVPLAPLGLFMAGGPPAMAASGVTATFTKTQDWGTGYQATYTITNNTAAVLVTWTVSFTLPSGQQMGTFWDANETASGTTFTFTNRSYNGNVPANGGTASFGFNVSYSGTFAPPANCTVNGSPCGGGGGGGGGTITAPTGLAVTGTTSSSVSLSWQAVSNAASYIVLRDASRVATVTSTSATVTGLAAATSYTFTVEASDAAGNVSQPSSPVSATTQPSGGGGGAGGGTMPVAPYVDLTNNQEGMLDQAANAGLKAFTAAFVIGSGCTPIWGDTLPVTSDPAVTADITRAESEGAQPIVSFGGAAGIELAQSCPNLSQLVAAYQSVINTLHVNHIDFDIEGAAIADTATNNLRFQAINQLAAANPGLVVSLTIPTFPTGPDFNGQAFLKQAAADGTHVSVVNVMAMDYYGGFDGTGTSMGSYAVQAAQDTLSFLQGVFPGATYSMVGVTPMIGQNDDSAEVFTEADAHTLVSFAQASHLGRLAFWSVDRDQACSGSASGLSQCSQISQQPLDFTKIFDQYTG